MDSKLIMSNLVLKFAANISTMFHEVDVLNRLDMCRRFGFTAFEAQNLYDIDIENLLAKKNGLDMVLINSPPDIKSNNTSNNNYFGYACLPGKEVEFQESLSKAIEFAKSVGCRKVHILAGLKDGSDKNELRKTYIENLKRSALLLEKENLIGVIEPLCPEIKPNYFLDSFDDAIEYIKEVGSDHLKLLLDVFHLEMLHKDTLNLMSKFYPYAGHVQVSQAPDRDEPSAKGRIDYQKVFELLNGYSDFIGLEYTPKRSTVKSLSFLKPCGYFTVNL
ncbi:putative hydroxypyruvate isomerase [Parasteatoda tepidariorum]|uniref:putative hydroxypyruvate isomerase n=1 Tax=Parasteatoda tepidariorum TaxID=114398 RepID=UPI00077FBF83|nr:putative hydroxypyruvate isomerase isoform X2 [Parasteatoda tepidariorum]